MKASQNTWREIESSLFVLLSVVVYASACSQYIRSCGDGIATGLTVSTTPAFDTLKKGDTYTVHTEYVMTQPISSGKNVEKATLGGLTVLDQTGDLCDALKDLPAEGQCPLNPGQHQYDSSSEIKSSLPSGHYLATSEWKTDSGERILCLETSLCL